ncbi:MAG TPA: DUF6766 family protein [Chloroflexia bacterium]|nr:DUF6766 family protein [Chloroflexia bacterium]
MKQFLRNNGLSIAMFALFFIFLSAQTVTGFMEYNEDQQAHQQSEVGFGEYLGTGHYIEAVFENWESEFLQMAAYVVLTAFLFQKGSSESKDPDKPMEAVDEDPRKAEKRKDTPWPVKKGGMILKLYENSLAISLVFLFLMSFLLHAYGGMREFNQEQMEHGEEGVSFFGYFATSRFWFESFQNWQSEFLAVGSLIVLSIFLRQKGSPESKPVAAAHSETPG